MNDSRFDTFTKALATPTTRRAALVRIGSAVTTAIVASWPFGHALASNSACAHFCAAVFGADTPAAGQCTSDAAHGKGLCHQCGSVKPSSICCTRNSSGFCSSYSGTTCCDACSTCQSGTCVSSCASGLACLCNGTCATPCSFSNNPCVNPFFCYFDLDQTHHYCVGGCPPGGCAGLCKSDCDCPGGQFCSTPIAGASVGGCIGAG